MTQGWITVFMGPVQEAELWRSELEAKGIPVFIPEESLRTVDPFVVGGLLIFDRAVQVPSSAVEAARAHMARTGSLDDESEMRAGEQELPNTFFEDESKSEAELSTRATALSRRIRWSAVSWIGAPFALMQIRPYLETVKLLGHKPPLHKTTLAAACISPLICLINLVFFFMR